VLPPSARSIRVSSTSRFENTLFAFGVPAAA
jgi:hypothetical protein